MILTYKMRHTYPLKETLRKAREVANFAVKNRVKSSKEVKQFGLQSSISCQIIRKYAGNKKCKKVRRVVLPIPGQGIKLEGKTIRIPCLNLTFTHSFPYTPTRINNIEINRDTIFVRFEVADGEPIDTQKFIGVDLNSTGHAVVVANPATGKVIKMGKKAWHIRKKYKAMRRGFQRKKKFRKVKSIGNREARIIRDMNHKMSRKIVDYAAQNGCGVRLENLKGIRKNTGGKKGFSHNVNSWPFYQLRQMVEYKAKLRGVTVQYVAPAYTSQICSRSGLIGQRDGDTFKSPKYGVESAHVNAAFNIANAISGVCEENGVESTDSIVRRKRFAQGATDMPGGVSHANRSGESSGNDMLHGVSQEP